MLPTVNQLLAVTALVAMLVAWVAVQRLWLGAFSIDGEADALAERGGCGSCSCVASCRRKPSTTQRQEPLP